MVPRPTASQISTATTGATPYLTYDQANALAKQWAQEGPGGPLHQNAQTTLDEVDGTLTLGSVVTTGPSLVTVMASTLGVVESANGTIFVQIGVANGHVLWVVLGTDDPKWPAWYGHFGVGSPESGGGSVEIITIGQLLAFLNKAGSLVEMDLWNYDGLPLKSVPIYADVEARSAGEQQRIIAALRNGSSDGSVAFGPLTSSTDTISLPVMYGVGSPTNI